jgi:hypothetical protein
MPTSARFPDGRSQVFTFPRRELLQSLASVALPLLIPRSQPVDSFFGGRPLPQFKIGDLVAEDWINDSDDEDGEDEHYTEFGEVLGVRWLPEGHSCYPANVWLYYICWTHSTCPGYSYPCYDGEPTEADRLRLVNHV